MQKNFGNIDKKNDQLANQIKYQTNKTHRKGFLFKDRFLPWDCFNDELDNTQLSEQYSNFICYKEKNVLRMNVSN